MRINNHVWIKGNRRNNRRSHPDGFLANLGNCSRGCRRRIWCKHQLYDRRYDLRTRSRFRTDRASSLVLKDPRLNLPGLLDQLRPAVAPAFIRPGVLASMDIQ